MQLFRQEVLIGTHSNGVLECEVQNPVGDPEGLSNLVGSEIGLLVGDHEVPPLLHKISTPRGARQTAGAGAKPGVNQLL